MSIYVDLLEAIKADPLRFDGDRYESAVESLHTLYSLHHPIDNSSMRDSFLKLEGLLAQLPMAERNKIFCLFCDIYYTNEKEAFQQGFRFGFRMADELSQPDEDKPWKPQSWAFPCHKITKEAYQELQERMVTED